MTIALRAEALVRVFPSPGGDVHACDGIDLALHPGEMLVVRGRSGAGKTTLLNLLGLLDRPTSGRVVIGDTETTGMSEAQLAGIRRDRLGFIFQSFGLVPVLSARENVELPLRIAEVDPAERDRRVAEALDRVGLGGHGEQRPAELSGGQQQRVGIARAIVADAPILIADEPTGQLDSQTAATIMDLLGELAHDRGLAAIVSTHDPLLVARADRVLELHDGRIVDGGSGATTPGSGADATVAVARGAAPASGADAPGTVARGAAPASGADAPAADAPAADAPGVDAPGADATLTRAELRRRREGR
ncbi:ABC transporter ATP-binding protein [Microbacterium invictum]|uniref:ABC transport system ATP-binding protein n=1 Tax=Microbacterium invictum TaxID=515415 RepID=A0AA40VNR3_9MICO|nr:MULTISPECIES: ABC transporter ATP-binding protein [Microbacterium]MBB4141109.1 putative ABC transport system ATP-binding protein [Microbacterium invictum]